MIASFLANSRYERILRLLDLERKVILNGPLVELKALVDRREAAMAEVLAAAADLPEAFLAALKAKAERNSRLILASLAGVKAAEAQIAQIRDAREQLRTYTAEGANVEVRHLPVTRDHRA